ncbi:MAG: type II toxin-antitoxin system YafQ family toxin [Synergistaceae bacterium]|nr:type II toxin-antitoxin system YafQ family toxin [Synergistota bacterium]NLM70421.1 type II toxin-antitoxin system YafQ family toxin [Synergistaceae bacterium]
MRSVRQTAAFKRDFKRESKGPSRLILKERLLGVISALAIGEPLDPSYRDHSLGGNWRGHRECHIAPDLLLLYHLSDETLTLVRLGSHAKLFGL